MVFAYIAAATVLLPIAWLLWYIHIPWNMPSNIPAVPIYVSLIGLWSDMGQDEIYDRWLRKPLEKYGAVKIWFAGRWSILVTRPDLLTDMFRHEDVYAKAGSQKKIPWSVIAALVGDNIINSHGETWKLYTNVMKPGMQRRNWDFARLHNKSTSFVSLLLDEQREKSKEGVLVNPLVQRLAISLMGESFLDMDFGCLEVAGKRIEVLQTIIKKTIFKPLFFNFPSLDQYPNLFKSRAEAFKIMKEFEDLLYELVKNRPNKINMSKEPSADDQVIHALERALEAGIIDDTQFRANLKITFLTAHENFQQLMNSTFWELGSNTETQDRLRAEIYATGIATPTPEVVNQMPYLAAVINELLRVYPPVSQLINRVALEDAALGGTIPVPKGTWVGWNCIGVHTNTDVWGPDAKEFRPERWGNKVEQIQSMFRRVTIKGAYIPFNAHTRKCLGQGFVLTQMKIVLFELIRSTKWVVHPDYKFKLTSGGILAPLGCRIMIEELEHRVDATVPQAIPESESEAVPVHEITLKRRQVPATAEQEVVG